MTLVLTLLFALQGAMDDASAIVKAKSIWGPSATIAEARTIGDTYWTKQVGCFDAGTRAFIIAGQALNTWDAAFAAVDMTMQGQVSQNAWLCNPMPLKITSPAELPGGTVGALYKITLTAAGGLAPYTWSLVSGETLPPGLSLQTSGIVGAPTTAGTYTFKVQVQTIPNVPTNLPITTAVAPLTITVQ